MNAHDVKRIALLLIISMAMAPIIGCSSDKKAWEDAGKADTIEFYQKFIQENPKSQFIGDARTKIEGKNWKKAQKIDTVKAYEEFIKKYPKSGNSGEAKQKIEEKDWEEAQKANTIKAYKKFLSKHPSGIFAKTAKQGIEKKELSYMKAGPWKFEVISFVTQNDFEKSSFRIYPRENNKLALIKVKFTRIRPYTNSEKKILKKSKSYDTELAKKIYKDNPFIHNGMLGLIFLSEDKSEIKASNCLFFDGTGMSITSDYGAICMETVEKNGESTEQTLVFNYGPWDKNPVLFFSPYALFKGGKASDIDIAIYQETTRSARISILKDDKISVEYDDAEEVLMNFMMNLLKKSK